MQPLERAGYLAHARTPAFARRLAEAEACVTEALRLCESPYVAWSGGKDSSALLWLVLQQEPRIPVRMGTWWETRALHSDLDAIIDFWQRRFPGLDFVEIRQEGTPEGDAYGPWEGHLRYVLFQTGAFDGCFLGLRAEESNARKLALRRGRLDPRFAIHRYEDTVRRGSLRIAPLEHWSTADVAAVLATHNLPLFADYTADGIETRTTGKWCDASTANGAEARLRRRDPRAWNTLVARDPRFQRRT